MKRIAFAAACLTFGLAALSAAAETGASKKTDKDAPTRQELIDKHQKMADLHLKMVECLKSDKGVDECRKAAMKDCPMAKSGKCPFMEDGCAGCGMKGHHHGKGKAQAGGEDEEDEKGER